MLRAATFLFLAMYMVSGLKAELLIDFEGLPVNNEGFYNGDVGLGGSFRANYTILQSPPDGIGEFIQTWNQGPVAFGNNYNSQWDSWSGWVWSNVSDSSSPGFGNQYASYPGGGSDGQSGIIAGQRYAVAFGTGAYFDIPTGYSLVGVDLANTTYAAISMRDGDQFAKKFGGALGNDPDYFFVELTGYSDAGGVGNELSSIVVNLADFRFADNSLDYILGDWTSVDLSALAGARSVGLRFESSDVGPFGINTPVYLALDNLRIAAVPEPAGAGLFIFALVATSIAGKRRAAAAKRAGEVGRNPVEGATNC